ncbi:hypothetical protein CI109_100213 [Kwoniella shandongensis]|uniref:Uncharacterized protein n=1 Tax=Kwoniella shandongensis TaxID=1734106 RepID=A0A5M6BRC5_9TREE|nr:uncharacterized protein CI109_006252 [Kwoniella shandongensis]KAA5525448.1 hypothetical protein CI109_006252 [Kwoniella shandongensis]
MNGLSDLELVAQAMSTTTRTTTAPPPSANADRSTTNGTVHPSNTNHDHPTQTLDSLSLPDDIDLSKLSAEEISLLQPLIDALSLSAPSGSGSGEDGDGEGDEMNESQITSILKQLEAADGVADDLESKLDRLLATLGGVEEEIGEGVQVDGGDAESKEKVEKESEKEKEKEGTQ